MFSKLLAYIFCILFIFFSACEQKEKKEGLVITVTTSIIQDGLKNLVPDDVEIISLMGPGIDPHLYKPTSADLGKLKRADIIVYNGLSLEGKMVEILETLSKKKPTIAVSHFADQTRFIQSAAFKGSFDPHIWFDVELWRSCLMGLNDSINSLKKWEVDETKSVGYSDSLKSLHLWIQNAVDQIPPEKKVLISSHDAFGYFGRAYGIEVVGLQGISTLSEAGLKDIENLIAFIIERKINHVFMETIISPKAIQAVVEGCELKGYKVEVGGTLYSDAMGPVGTSEENYLGMIRYNVETIVNSLK